MRSRFLFIAAVVLVFVYTPRRAESYLIPVAGLPSVTVKPQAVLPRGVATPLDQVLQYNAGAPICMDSISFAIAPCTLSSVLISPSPNPDYTISGGYTNTFGQTVGDVVGSALPLWDTIYLTANSNLRIGTLNVSGFINPQTANYAYGAINWGGTVPDITFPAYMKLVSGSVGVDLPPDEGKIVTSVGIDSYGLTLQQAAALGGYDHFNWLSTITGYSYYGQEEPCISIGPLSIQIRCTGFDPQLGGAFGVAGADNYDPYWNEVNCFFCLSSQYYGYTYNNGDNQIISNQDVFADSPNLDDRGWTAYFNTQLIGVKANHTEYDILSNTLGEPDFGFNWSYTQTKNCLPFQTGCGWAVYANTDPALAGGGDITFLGFGEPIQTPEPSSLILLGSAGLLGTLPMSRVRRVRRAATRHRVEQ